jgi:hypothetical protein
MLGSAAIRSSCRCDETPAGPRPTRGPEPGAGTTAEGCRGIPNGGIEDHAPERVENDGGNRGGVRKASVEGSMNTFPRIPSLRTAW